jgi:hypothetical protein
MGDSAADLQLDSSHSQAGNEAAGEISSITADVKLVMKAWGMESVLK